MGHSMKLRMGDILGGREKDLQVAYLIPWMKLLAKNFCFMVFIAFFFPYLIKTYYRTNTFNETISMQNIPYGFTLIMCISLSNASIRYYCTEYKITLNKLPLHGTI